MPSIPRCNKDRIRDGLCPSDESRSWRHPNPGINLGWACLWVRAPRAEGGKVGGFSIEMQISIDPMKRHATRQLQAGRRSKTRMAHDACLLPPASEEEKRKSRRENTKGAERSCCTAGSCSATQANQRRLFRIRLFRRDKIACGPCWPFGGAGAAVGPLLPCCCCCHPPCRPALLPCFWRSLPLDSGARSHGGSGVGTTRTKRSSGIDPCPRWPVRATPLGALLLFPQQRNPFSPPQPQSVSLRCLPARTPRNSRATSPRRRDHGQTARDCMTTPLSPAIR